MVRGEAPDGVRIPKANILSNTCRGAAVASQMHGIKVGSISQVHGIKVGSILQVHGIKVGRIAQGRNAGSIVAGARNQGWQHSAGPL